MKPPTDAPANVHVDPEFKSWTPPAIWWEQPERLSSLMTFYLCRPGGIARSEAVSIVKPYIKERGYKTRSTVADWKAHAKWWTEPKRHPEFIFDEKAYAAGTLVLISDGPLGRKELIELIERLHRNTRNRRGHSGTVPVKYEPKDYDIGNGSKYVYAYYYPRYREKGEADFLIKIGRANDYPERIKAQTTEIPEEAEVSVVWRTDQPEAAEKLLHGLLTFRGKHVLDAPGREWFRTSPHEIRQIIECIQPGVSIQNIPTAEGIQT